MTNLDTLARLAAEATPGPWTVLLHSVYPEGRQPGWQPLMLDDTHGVDARWPILAGENMAADAAFIAAANPITVVALVRVAQAALALEAIDVDPETMEESDMDVILFALRGNGVLGTTMAHVIALRAALASWKEATNGR